MFNVSVFGMFGFQREILSFAFGTYSRTWSGSFIILDNDIYHGKSVICQYGARGLVVPLGQVSKLLNFHRFRMYLEGLLLKQASTDCELFPSLDFVL